MSSVSIRSVTSCSSSAVSSAPADHLERGRRGSGSCPEREDRPRLSDTARVPLEVGAVNAAMDRLERFGDDIRTVITRDAGSVA